jgi:hypothetical protein
LYLLQAFLKHASPAAAEKPKRTSSVDTTEVGSMPSLASEESPAERKTDDMKTVSVAGASAMPELMSSEKTAVNALLMAAMAMTEISGHDTQATTPPPPAVKMDELIEDNHKTPQRNLLGAFKSPKQNPHGIVSFSLIPSYTLKHVLRHAQESSRSHLTTMIGFESDILLIFNDKGGLIRKGQNAIRGSLF